MVSTVQPIPKVRETPRLISTAKIAGSNVENTKGEKLGHIEEIMIDKLTGRVDYAVLKYGSFLGLGGKLFALPWSVLRYDPQRDAYVVGIPDERLKNAPCFDAEAWPDMGDPIWGKGIYDYYGSTAEWLKWNPSGGPADPVS
jgi:hypothetical protein